ncbi:hypothetical protein ACH5BF_00565 [Arcobacter sp. YIC-464]|uniref:hypothetical protein n=1 Tax=Arcobacter sp. YIC-464 TaxID=3376631 RepID=UPI003C20B1F1
MIYEIAIEEYLNEDDNGKHKLIYAYFGLAIYKSQCLEETFSNMLLLHRTYNKTLTSLEDIDKEISSSSKKTMGKLIQEIKIEYNFPNSLEEDLSKVLNTRNYLVHKYFKENIQKFFTETGQKEMLNFFSEFIDKSTQVDNELDLYYKHYKDKFSFTDDVIENIISNMKEEEIIRVSKVLK